MTPLSFDPIIKRIRWGGTRLGSVLGKPLGSESDYAESWEIADHGDDQSIVSTGDCAGQALGRIVANRNADLFGTQAGMQQFPLLIKYLDANDWLSLQVHPNDEQAKTYDVSENGKTEAWIIIAADPGSKICVGLKEGVTKQQFSEHLEAGTVEETLHMFEVQAGDCVFVPAGTVHAIGSGVLLAEVQQQSDLTFRLHDWGRMGSDGKPRQLHIEQSLACIDFDRGPVNPVVPKNISEGAHTHEELVRGEYFVIERHRTTTGFTVSPDGRFKILMLLEGEAIAKCADGDRPLPLGSTLLVPATSDPVQVVPSGAATVLEVCVP
jgi:mannose-6-phosphate isomerase